MFIYQNSLIKTAYRNGKIKMPKIYHRFLLGFCLAILLAGCNSTEDEDKKEEKEKLQSILDPAPPEKKVTQSKGISSDAIESYKFAKGKNDSDELAKLGQDEKTTKKANKVPFYDKFLEKEGEQKGDDQEVALVYDAAELGDVVPAFAHLLGFNYIIDPKVKGAVTINVTSKMTKRELWQVFEQILWLSGAYCSPDDGNLIHILPYKNMPTERKMLVDGNPKANVEVAIIDIRNASSKDIIEKIKPFMTEGATAIDISHQNAVMIVEAPSNMPKLRNLISMLDKKNKANWPQVVIRCVNVSSNRIRDELAEILPVLGFPVSLDGSDPSSINLISVERLQVLLASAANEEALEELKEWVRVLDRTDVGEQERIFIYKVINGKAEELYQAISAIFTAEGTTLSASSSSSSLSSSSSSSSSSSKSVSSAPVSNSTSKSSSSSRKSSSSSNSDSGPSNIFEVPVKVFTDAVQNRLVIRTTPRTYAMVKALLVALDTAPSQVLLQVMVVEITLTNNTQFGLEFSRANQFTAGEGSYKNLYKTNYEGLVPGASNEYGFTYLLTNPDNPDEKFAYLKALAGKGKVNVISSPQLLVQSHSEAQITVGNQVPIVTSEITDTQSVTDDSTAVKRSVEYQDTGIILTIKPHITKGGYISFDLEQTVSDAVTNTTSGIDSPEIQERVLKTTMAIRDGSTLIVGGLIRERIEDTQSTVPFISDLPLIGRLVGDNDINKTRTELLVLINGKVITENSKLDDLLTRYKQAVKSIKDLEKMEAEGLDEAEKKDAIDTAERLLNLKNWKND
jgi:general secretion pathway protein D